MTEQREQDGQRETTVASASSSPYATGGGGVTFERRVATRYLAHLLTGASSPELDNRRVVGVAFQQAPSHPVDDLVVLAARDGEDMASLELSVGVRRSPDFVISDMDTKKLIGSFLIAAQERSAEGVERRLAICVAGPQNAAAQVEELANLARTRNAAAFYRDLAVPGRFHRTWKDRLKHLKALVKANLEASGQDSSDRAVDAASWLLLSQLHVLMPRLEPPDELDWAGLLDQLESWARDPTRDAASSLRSQLEVLAARYAPAAAPVDLTILRRDAHDCLNLDRRRSQQAWAELNRLDGEARAAIRSNIGGGDGSLKLPRPVPEGELRRAIGAPNLVIVTGDSGVGKSALVKAVIEAQDVSDDAEFQAVMLDLRQLPAQMAELRAWLGQPLERLLGELSAPNRILVIDAADFVLKSGDQMLRALVTAAQSARVSVWVVSATEGLAAVKSAVETLPGRPLEIDIEGLTDEDIALVVDAFPALRRLADDARARELLRRPVVADLLARSEPGSLPLSDSDALNVIWGKLIRNDGRSDRGMPAAREQVLLQLAQHGLEQSDPAAVFAGLNPEGLEGLRRDGLLRTPDNPWLTLPALAHDLLRTFAVAKLLLSDGDPAARLQTHGAPRWTLPAARLAAQVMLAGPATPAWPPAGRLARLQDDFDRLATAGFGERWSDLPTESVLTLPNAPLLLGDTWAELVADEAAGLKRVLRIIDQRHSKAGLADRLVAQPVMDLLLDRDWPAPADDMVTDLFRSWLRPLLMTGKQAGEPTRIKLREHLVEFVAAGDRRLAEIAEQQAAALAARTAEEKAADKEQQNRIQRISGISGGSRRRRRYVELPEELISESTMELLALLGPDLGADGEDLLRRVAADDPYRLAPALEPGLTGLGLCRYRPKLLVELVEAYYLDDDIDAEDGFGGGLHDDGTRDHQFGGLGTPLAAYYRGPFIWMFRSSFRESVACLNRLLNHAARFRVAILHSMARGRPGRPDPDHYRTELSLTGAPRSYIGDGQVWVWYRGTGVGPYPCMSALQALELVCDEFIEAGAPLDCLVSVLLDDCENLAMPALVVGLLVRHLEKAGEALDPYLVEPAIWHLEFSRIVNESSGLAANAASVKSPERRKWNLREASMMLALYADEARAQQLRELGDRLFARALELHGVTEPVEADDELAEELASVRGWAGALDRASYQFTQTDEGIVVEQKVDPEVEKALAGTNEDSRRVHHGYRLWNRYPERHDRHAKHAAVTLDELIDDLAVAKDLLENPPARGPGNRYEAPAAVAAAALEAQFRDRLNVPHKELIWSAGVLFDVVEDRRSVHPNDRDEFSYFSRGADRAAARGLPLLLLPQADEIRVELMTARGLTDDQISDNLAWLLSSGANEARLFAAMSLDLVWATPWDHTAPCRHSAAISLVEESLRGCCRGAWNDDGRTEPPRLEGDVAAALDRLDGEEIVVPFLSAAIRALGAAAMTDNCERGRSHELLAAVLAAHRRGMAASDYGYQHSHTDSLIAARALLMRAADGGDALLFEHFDSYAEDSRLLEELLKALAAAAEENQQAADTARRLWPTLIDRGLDLLGEPKPPSRRQRWRRQAIAAFMPNPAYDYGYLYRELDSDPIVWTDVEAWQPQVARWLPMAAGQRESLDSLVHLLHSVPDDQQGRLGLIWVETLVRADPSEVAWKSYLLPEWLHDVRPHIHEADLIDCWQRIVDMLIVAGDTRVADLAD